VPTPFVPGRDPIRSEEKRRKEKRKKPPNTPGILQALLSEPKSVNPSPLPKQASI
jgi:hypothetical protein